MADLFSEMDLYQVYNYYRGENSSRSEKVLRTFGTKEECESYINKYKWDLDIEPYNADEWDAPKLNGCCILPCENFKD